MAFRVINNMTSQPASRPFATEEIANRTCAQLNLAAYRAGNGGLYGVEEVS